MVLYEDQLKNHDFLKNSHSKRKHKKGAKKITWCDDIFTFDIETTSGWINEHGNIIKYKAGKPTEYWNNLEPVSLCYIWQFSVNDIVYYGRELSDFKKLLDDIPKDINIIIWVHNLSFEFHFLLNILTKVQPFCRQPHKPMKFTCEEFPHIDFRCSYMLTRLSLASWGAQIGCNKLVGDLDYEKIRTPKTVLTAREMAYCEQDCIVVFNGIKDYLKRYHYQNDIPLTQTGTVRREVKELLTSNPQYVKEIKKLVPRDAKEYDRLRAVFAGGYTHANRAKAGIIQSGIIEHYDFSSAYPCELVKQKYPCSPWIYTGSHELPPLENFDKYAYIMLLHFEDIECITFNTYIQMSKTSATGAKSDNGRLLCAKTLDIWVTEQDYLTISETYRWNKEKFRVDKLYLSFKKYLPTPFVKYLLELYGNKTTLKGAEEGSADYDIYMQSKQYINSLFGMCVTSLIQSDVTFNETTGEWGMDVLTEEMVNNHLEKLRSWSPRERRYFLNYSWGVYCTAYARRDLWRCLLGEKSEKGYYKNDINVIYADTDSLFMNGKQDFSWYNTECIKKLDDAMVYHNLPLELTRPVDKKGKPHQLGIFEKENNCKEFITLGAKRYCERREDGKLYLTVSGINKDAVYVLNNDISNFKNGVNFDKDFATVKKSLVTYISNQQPLTWPDGYKSVCHSGVNLRRNGYKLTISDEYKTLIKYLDFDVIQLPEEFKNHLRGRWIKKGEKKNGKKETVLQH